MGPAATPHRAPPTSRTRPLSMLMGFPRTRAGRVATLSTALMSVSAGRALAMMLGDEGGRIMICMECAEGIWA